MTKKITIIVLASIGAVGIAIAAPKLVKKQLAKVKAKTGALYSADTSLPAGIKCVTADPPTTCVFETANMCGNSCLADAETVDGGWRISLRTACTPCPPPDAGPPVDTRVFIPVKK